jgi:Family of unknown function (DUF6455)
MPAPVRQPTHICEMMERLGLAPGGGVVPRWSLAYTTAFHRCETCTDKQACRDWLERMPAQVSFAPRFCPNADIFFELQVEQPGAGRADGCVPAR